MKRIVEKKINLKNGIGKKGGIESYLGYIILGIIGLVIVLIIVWKMKNGGLGLIDTISGILSFG